MASQTVVLITDAHQGIGEALVGKYLDRAHTTVIAAVPKAGIGEHLHHFAKNEGSNLIVIDIDLNDLKSAKSTCFALYRNRNIKNIHIVIANTSVVADYNSIADLSLSVLQEHISIHTYSPLVLFQAVLPFIKFAEDFRKFVVLSSFVGSIAAAGVRPIALTTGFGISKAAVHYITRKISLEFPNIIAFPIDPGFVQTRNTNPGTPDSPTENPGAVRFSSSGAPIGSFGESIHFIVSTIDGANSENLATYFPAHEGGMLPW